MLTLPPFLLSACEWQLEEKMISELLPGVDVLTSYNPNETDTSHYSSSCSPRLQYEEIHISSNNAIKKPLNPMKKSCHNEYERDRRKKLNKLYSSLRQLLPEKELSNKLSIPCTIARVLNYIPELKSHIERLKRKKEEILLRVSKDEATGSTFIDQSVIYPVISAICLTSREVMIQICILNPSETIPLSKIVKVLERKGLQLMNATTQTTHDSKIFYSLHLQAKENIKMVGKIFCLELISSLNEHMVSSMTTLKQRF